MSSDYQKVLSAVKMTAQQDLSPEQKKVVLKALPELKKVYDKVQMGSGRMKGRGFWDWLSTAASDVNQWLKDNKVLSKISAPVLEYIIPAVASVIGSPVSGAVASGIGFAATEGLKSLGYGKKMKKMKMMGGDSRLVINKPGQRLTGKGITLSYNGVISTIPKQMGGSCMCGGGGSSFYSVSSEFGKIKI